MIGLRNWMGVINYAVSLWMMFWNILIVGFIVYSAIHAKPSPPCYPMRGEVHVCAR
jgi:hypothetical protein